MPTVPVFPLLPDGALPPLALLLRWLEQVRGDGAEAVRLERLPLGNGSLPDLLRLAGIGRLELARPPLERAFRWDGCGGGRVAAAPAGTDGDTAAEPLRHHGHLPCDAADADGDGMAIAALVDLARLEDASALRGHGSGAAWDHILAAAGMGRQPRIPPLAGHGATGSHHGAWNPLPFARHLVVALPLPKGTPPWGLEDQRGARHPVQVVEGPLGRELLTDLRLGALECARFTPLSDPVPGAHWEVGRTVIDNGRLRAELDPLGQVVRLCCNGRFAALSGPALQPLVDGLPLSGAATATVLEEGPVRARVTVSRVGAQGALHLIYTLHAHEDVLRVAASWDGAGELTLDHPTTHRGGMLRLGGELAATTSAQAASVLPGDGAGEPWRGVRWATLGAESGLGLGLAAPRALAVAARSGHLLVHVERSASYALGNAEGASDALGGEALGLPRLGLALAVPGRAYTGEHALPAAFRLHGGDQLVPWWVRRPAGWAGELTFTEVSGRRVRAVLHPTDQGAGEAWRVDARGEQLDHLPATPEGDGYEIEAGPYEVVIVRWR